MGHEIIKQLACARIPIGDKQFKLYLYSGDDGREHLALVLGDVKEQQDLLIRIHSECFTGEVLGSRRCDCGPQLYRAIELIGQEGAGVLIYLRQEGRGIGLLEKLRAYDLQDAGYDTVDANIQLGHGADKRDYAIAAHILRDLDVRTVRVLTNNPAKMESLERCGFPGSKRIPLQAEITLENRQYLETKARRMRHYLDLRHSTFQHVHRSETSPVTLIGPPGTSNGRPYVTLTYAQSIDGSITVRRGEPMELSCEQSLAMTHELRAQHDAILVGIETVIADDPRLTVRLAKGPNPIPVVLDSRLRIPLNSQLLKNGAVKPWIATTDLANAERQCQLEELGAKIVRLPANPAGQVDLKILLSEFLRAGISSLMVEGGARVITSFLSANLVDRLVLTIAPLLVGGLNAVSNLMEPNNYSFPSLHNPRYQSVGDSIVLFGNVRQTKE